MCANCRVNTLEDQLLNAQNYSSVISTIGAMNSYL